jgi:hypothetical protein
LIEREAIDCLTIEVARRKAEGTRVSLGELYEHARIEGVIKGKKHEVPKIMAWLEKFKYSPQSSRIPGRRPRQ